MLHDLISNFLEYCKTSNFSERSIETFTLRLNEFKAFLQLISIESIGDINYEQLLQFVTDYGHQSPHVKKARVWTLHQFYHFLKLNKIIEKNIALKLAYPKIEKSVPNFLTINEFKKILNHFVLNADSIMGLRNLMMLMLLGFLGLRTSEIISLNIEDVDLTSGLIWVRKKGCYRKRQIIIPQMLCSLLSDYLQKLNLGQGPLFLSKRNKRISERTLQNLFRESADNLNINKRLHPHLFRHTAGTHLNKVAGPEITQRVLGHARRENTKQYVHLNPDQVALLMKKHPYMQL
jgi:site-specific recombinase XerD